MGKKVFVSYKYSDSHVLRLPGISTTTVRDYVDELQEMLEEDHINKGEDDGEDMSSLQDSTIGSKLGDKIFDSTVTIVMISKGMKENTPEKEQWIPWEVSHSLREQSRQGVNSKTNAILAVVLPDTNNSYEYFITYNEECDSMTLHTDFLFEIIRENMFNLENPDFLLCNGRKIYSGHHSYIHSVKWEDFIEDIDKYIKIAVDIYKERDKYNIKKKLN